MKYLVYLLLFVPAVAFSQAFDDAAAVPAGASYIKISGIGVHNVIRGFLDAGYPIEKSGHTLKTIISKPKKLSRHNLFTVLKVDISESGIVISGEYGTNGTTSLSDIRATDQKGGPGWDSWQEMLVFANSFKKPIEFVQNN